MGTKELKTDEKLNELLCFIKKEKPESYESLKRVLRYLYKGISEDYFEKRIILDPVKDSERESYPRKVNEAKKNLYDCYINGENTILDLLIKMCHDEPKYFETFFNEIEINLEMLEEHLYSNYELVNYVFNIYTMLKGYELCNGDYEFFSRFIKGISNIYISSKIDILNGYSSYGKSNYAFLDKKEIIDELVKLKLLSNNQDIDELMIEILDEVNIGYSSEITKKVLKTISDYQDLYNFMKKEEVDFNAETAKQMELNLKESLSEFKRKQQRYYNSSYDTLSYFSTVILIGDRYTYIEEKLHRAVPQLRLEKDILIRMEKWNYQLFDYLNKEMDLEQDSFITCMNSVLDSDTFYEVISKMDSIQEASEVCLEDPKKALSLINALNTNQHKEVIDGNIMKWPESNSINKSTKPETILERMIALHSTCKYAPSERSYIDMASSSYYTGDMKMFVRKISDAFVENKRAEEKRLEQEKKEKETQPVEPKKTKGLGGLFKK